MLKSMTGYGKATGTFQGKKITIEVRSLNSKSLDLNIRCAPFYKELEGEIRKVIGEQLDRGKVDLSLSIDSTGESKNYSINKDLAKAYTADLKSLEEITGKPIDDYATLILRMPDIFNYLF